MADDENTLRKPVPPGRLVDPFGRELTILGEKADIQTVYRLLTEVLAASGGRVWLPDNVARNIPANADVQIAVNDRGRAITLKDFAMKPPEHWWDVMDDWKRGLYYDVSEPRRDTGPE